MAARGSAARRGGGACRARARRRARRRQELLDDAARLEHHDAVAKSLDQAQIVADEEKSHAAPLDQLVEERQHLHRRARVERRGRLVGDHEVGLARQHHGDHRALPHAARKLVRIKFCHARRVGEANGVEQSQRRLARVASAQRAMEAQGFLDLRSDPHHRVEREARVLRDPADAPAAQHGACRRA